MRAAAIALLLLPAGCGQGGGGEGKVDDNQLARLSNPAPPPPGDPLAPARLQPLEAGDITHEGLSGPGCAFLRDGRILFVANQEDAIARIGGSILHLTHSASAGPSGGFFEDRQTSISVGRTDASDGPASALSGWPARITVTHRRSGAQIEQDGLWRCGA